MFQKIQQSPWTPWVLGFVIGLLVGLLVGQDQGRDHKGRLGKGMQQYQGMMMDRGLEKAQQKEQAFRSGMGMQSDRPLTPEEMGMQQMESALEGKTGDEFDKVFLEEMIAHHQGALNMASAVAQGAKHEELKKFAQSITDTQSKEIATMKQWIKDWGYGDASAEGAEMTGNVQH